MLVYMFAFRNAFSFEKGVLKGKIHKLDSITIQNANISSGTAESRGNEDFSYKKLRL